jgi:enterochelin esterase-like enzyme
MDPLLALLLVCEVGLLAVLVLLVGIVAFRSGRIEARLDELAAADRTRTAAAKGERTR